VFLAQKGGKAKVDEGGTTETKAKDKEVLFQMLQTRAWEGRMQG
jgi:hypothetical protein